MKPSVTSTGCFSPLTVIEPLNTVGTSLSAVASSCDAVASNPLISYTSPALRLLRSNVRLMNSPVAVVALPVPRPFHTMKPVSSDASSEPICSPSSSYVNASVAVIFESLAFAESDAKPILIAWKPGLPVIDTGTTTLFASASTSTSAILIVKPFVALGSSVSEVVASVSFVVTVVASVCFVVVASVCFVVVASVCFVVVASVCFVVVASVVVVSSVADVSSTSGGLPTII